MNESMTKKTPVNTPHWLQTNIVRITRIHFVYALIYALTIVIYHAWDLITPQAVLQRWTTAAILLIATTIVWYLARVSSSKNITFFRSLTYGLILVDIYVAAFTVYAERGMASRGVALFAVPIIVSAILMSRSALFATAALSVAAYSFMAVRYFVVNFNEGYNVELYSVVAFYSTCFFVFAALLWVVIRSLQRP